MRHLVLGTACLFLTVGVARADDSSHVFPTARKFQNALTLSPPAPLHGDAIGDVQLKLADRWALTTGVTIRYEEDGGDFGSVTVDAGIRLATRVTGVVVGSWQPLWRILVSASIGFNPVVRVSAGVAF